MYTDQDYKEQMLKAEMKAQLKECRRKQPKYKQKLNFRNRTNKEIKIEVNNHMFSEMINSTIS